MYRFMFFSFASLMGCPAPIEANSTNPLDSVYSEEPGDSLDDGGAEDSDDSQDPTDGGDLDDDQQQEDGCPDSWVLTYAIEGQVDITHTPLDIGNASVAVGGLDSDTLVLRVPNDGGVPANGQVVITSVELLQDFVVSLNLAGEIVIETYLFSSAADECGLASGQLNGPTIAWDECVFGSEHGTPAWSPDEGASGDGCLSDYRVEGIVDCIDDSFLASCTDGWLEDGENNLDYIYNQPLENLDFDSTDYERFTMTGSEYGAELPTYTNNRTWLSLEGELKSMSLEPTPDCLCAE